MQSCLHQAGEAPAPSAWLEFKPPHILNTQVSGEAKDLIRRLLVVDPAQRLTCEQVGCAGCRTLGCLPCCANNNCMLWIEQTDLYVWSLSSAQPYALPCLCLQSTL